LDGCACAKDGEERQEVAGVGERLKGLSYMDNFERRKGYG